MTCTSLGLVIAIVLRPGVPSCFYTVFLLLPPLIFPTQRRWRLPQAAQAMLAAACIVTIGTYGMLKTVTSQDFSRDSRWYLKRVVSSVSGKEHMEGMDEIWAWARMLAGWRVALPESLILMGLAFDICFPRRSLNLIWDTISYYGYPRIYKSLVRRLCWLAEYVAAFRYRIYFTNPHTIQQNLPSPILHLDQVSGNQHPRPPDLCNHITKSTPLFSFDIHRIHVFVLPGLGERGFGADSSHGSPFPSRSSSLVALYRCDSGAYE
eukprot:1345312-Amorphochlora_amoeboformis.AAC.1